MSQQIIPLTRVADVTPIEGADRIALATVGGFEVIVGKDTAVGDPVIFIPSDSVIPQEWSDTWGITKHLDKQRVRAIKLRGVRSLGVAIPPTETEWAKIHNVYSPASVDFALQRIGVLNVAEVFGIEKYTPPQRFRSGGRSTQSPSRYQDHPKFHRYTGIENLRHYLQAFVDGEPVIATEKIHGSNSRVGRIDGEWMAGSHRVQRLHPDAVRTRVTPKVGILQSILNRCMSLFKAEPPKPETVRRLSPDTLQSQTYWYPLTLPGMQEMIRYLSENLGRKQVIVYGEIFGPGVQKGFDYGVQQGKIGYMVFDISLDGMYVNHDQLTGWCQSFKVPMVPVLGAFDYSIEIVKALSVGQSTVGGNHIREGVVVRPIAERQVRGIGRCIMKYVASDYLVLNHVDGANDEDLREVA